MSLEAFTASSTVLAAVVCSTEQAGRAESIGFFPLPAEAEPHKQRSPFPGGLLWKKHSPISFEGLQYLSGVYAADSNLASFPLSG